MQTQVVAGTSDVVPRRAFPMLEGDEEYLDATGLFWETIVDQNYRWLLLYRFPVPEGYNHRHVQLAIQISPGYPDAPLDMVYVFPPLARQDGRSIGALANQAIEGIVWQRWSRHRTTENPWRPGVDDVSTHIALIEDWLIREFETR